MTDPKTKRDFAKQVVEFIKTEVGAGLSLALAALLAIILANSPAAPTYFQFVNAHIPLQVGNWAHDLTVGKWIKEGLMAVFFLIVGLEIKYEVCAGSLSDPKTFALPVLAAIGGMAAPALIYYGLNFGGDLRGWSIPVATDIAFALAVLSLLGNRVPMALRLFLLTLAIVDDLGAVILIGVFYQAKLSTIALLWVGLGLLAMLAIPFLVRVTALGSGLIFAILFVFVWAMSLEAGVSTSLTAVLSAMCVSLKPAERSEESFLKTLMHALHPYVAYIILPIFAFSAAGVSFSAVNADFVSDSRFWGVALGLFLGKPIGVLAFVALALFLGVAKMPKDTGWGHILGISLLCGIGFTMSLYIAALAFSDQDPMVQTLIKLSIFTGSLASGIVGYFVLLNATQRNTKRKQDILQ